MGLQYQCYDPALCNLINPMSKSTTPSLKFTIQNLHLLAIVMYLLVAYCSGKRMVTGTRTGSRMKTINFKQRFLPHHKSQRRDILCTNSPVVSCFNPEFVDRSVPYEPKQRRVKFWRCFGNILLAECDVSVPNVRSSGTEPKAPVTDCRNRGSGNHTRG